MNVARFARKVLLSGFARLFGTFLQLWEQQSFQMANMKVCLQLNLTKLWFELGSIQTHPPSFFLNRNMGSITPTWKCSKAFQCITFQPKRVGWQLKQRTHTIRKVNFLSKNSILTEPQHFHEFFTQFFLTIFLVKSKLSTGKQSKTTTFSRVFHPKKSTIISGNQS